MTGLSEPVDLSHVDTWIFDLDDTLYPPEAEIMAMVSERMTAFVVRQTGLPYEEARALQKGYLAEHGTTLAGLMAHHGVEPHAFLDEVHDVSLDKLVPDAELTEALSRLPGRRLVFTNGDGKHAERILGRLEIRHLFDDVFHLETANWQPKPHPDTYRLMMATHGVSPRSAVFFEDSPRNLMPAAQAGMTTVLVGPHAMEADAPWVDHRAERLAPFLKSCRVMETDR